MPFRRFATRTATSARNYTNSKPGYRRETPTNSRRSEVPSCSFRFALTAPTDHRVAPNAETTTAIHSRCRDCPTNLAG